MHSGPASPIHGSVPSSIAIFLLLTQVIACTSAAAPDLVATIGEPVHLSGKALVTDQVYLFLTGPGLAHGGVNLNRINIAVATGNTDTFTIVPVENDRWQYNWQTTRLGKTLKEGTYRVYMATEPVGRDDLDRMGIRYDTIDIRFTLGSPDITLSVTPPVSSPKTRPVDNESLNGLLTPPPSPSFIPSATPQSPLTTESTMTVPARTAQPAAILVAAVGAAGLIILLRRPPPR